jgi:HlyD family secretion protein
MRFNMLNKRTIIIGFISLLVIVSLFVYIGQRVSRSRTLFYSGTIEARQSDLSFQVNGIIDKILEDEGAAVEKDRIIAELDQSRFNALLEQAKANLEVAVNDLKQIEINLDLSRKNLPADVRRAEAGVEALRANLSKLEAGYRSQDVEKAKSALLSAETAMKTAHRNMERIEKLFKEKIATENELDEAVLRYETALSNYEQAKENADQFIEGFRKETIKAARARLLEGEAILNQARENLKKIDAAESAVEAARARVKAAESALEIAKLQISYTRLRAPFDGIITSRNTEPGEYVTPGREVFSMADLSSVELKIFVSETDIGRVKPGQDVEVTVDTFPKKVFKGKVSFISPEAEFTPKIIQTHKERVKLVYLVKVLIPNDNLDLKPGMPADATIKPEQ